MNLDEQRYLERLQQDFGQVAPVLQQLVQAILREGISRFPVFIASRQEASLGLPIPKLDNLGLYWSFRASHLEELVKRAIIKSEELARFKERHNDPERQACLLLAPPGGRDARLVFLPFLTHHNN